MGLVFRGKGGEYYQLHAFKAEKTGFMADEANDSVLSIITLSLCEKVMLLLPRTLLWLRLEMR
jgi:hypothetical protein